MLNFNEIKTGKVIKINNDPYLIIKTDHHQMGRGGAILRIKARNLLANNVLEKTYQGTEKAEEAETKVKKADFLYKDQTGAYFMDIENYEQFSMPLEDIGDSARFLKDGTEVDVFYFESNPVSISLPVKMKFKVISAPPGTKGNSAGNVTKVVKIETGTDVSAPLFINEGDTIKVNTETGEYVERA